MDWKALLVVSILGSTRVIQIYLRGHLLRRTLRTALRGLPERMASVDVQVTDAQGAKAVVRGAVAPDQATRRGGSRP